MYFMNEKAFLERLVQRYINNQATGDELELFVYFLKQGKLDEFLEKDMRREIELQEQATPKRINSFTGRRQRKWLAIAASAALFIAVFYTSYQYREVIQNWINPIQYSQLQTGENEVKSLTLSDGTVIWLNAKSKLEYPTAFKGEIREVKLVSGEAFFKIAKSEKHKRFLVRTAKQVAVEALGTVFNVDIRTTHANVYLQSGSVKLNTHSGETLLSPGQLAVYDETVNKITVRVIKDETWLRWKDNLFVFDDVPLSEIASVIEQNFHIKVIIAKKSLAQERFTGKVSRDNLDTLLKLLSKTLKLKVVKGKNEIVMQSL